MPTLLLSARHSDDAQKLWRACIGSNWKIERVHGWQVPTLPANEVAIYGEPLFAQHAAQTLGLKLLEPPVDWLAKLPAKWSGRAVHFTTLGEARKTQTRAFIKPADEKCFDAKVYAHGGELPASGPLPENLPVLVQDVVEWETEFRCFVLDRRVMTLSPYWRRGQLAKDAEGFWPADEAELKAAASFCESVLDDTTVTTPPAIVIDVGILRNQGWAVVESNAAWASGIYGCNPLEVLKVLQVACVPNMR